MTWDGHDRRKNLNEGNKIQESLTDIQLNLIEVKTRLENLHSKVNSYNLDMKEKIEKHEEILNGNGKPGIVSTVHSLNEKFERHDTADRNIHKTVICCMIAVIAFLVKVVFF